MEKTLEVINLLKDEGIINDYAICGAVATIFYIEPVTTYDLDIFVTLKGEKKSILSLSSIYEWFKEKRYGFDKEHIVIEGVPVLFIPVYNELIEDAVSESVEKKYGNTITKVISPEYLISIMLQTNRAKDKERVLRFIKEFEIDNDKLLVILKKHNLIIKFNELKI